MRVFVCSAALLFVCQRGFALGPDSTKCKARELELSRRAVEAQASIESIRDPQQRAAVEAEVKEKQRTIGDALNDFKTGAGIGISVALGKRQDSIEEAAIINNKVVVTRRAKDVPRAAFEAHQLFTTNIFTPCGREAAVEQLRACEKDSLMCPIVGIGPFAAIQMGSSDVINSLGLGVMLGARTNPRNTSSFNVGLGIAFDAHSRRLAKGFTEGEPPPAGQTQVTFEEKSHRRLLLHVSFAF